MRSRGLALFDRFLNPVTLHELRNAVHGNFLTRTINVLLLILTGATGLLMAVVPGSDGLSPADAQAFLWTLSGCLWLISVLAIPGMTAFRLIGEKSSGELDLLMISGISPARLVLGKMLSATVFSLLLYTLSLPFITVISQFRGVDFFGALWMEAGSLALLFPIIQLNFLIAALPIRKGLQISLLILLFLGIVFFLLPIGLGIVVNLLMNNRGMGLAGAVLLFLVSLCALVFIALNALSVAALSPRASDRALRVRLVFFILWFLSSIGMLLLRTHSGPIFTGDAITAAWLIGCCLLFSCMMVASVAERDGPTARQYGGLPEHPVRRAFFFLFSSGSLNALLWALSLGLISIGLSCLHEGWSELQTAALGVLLWGLVLSLAGHWLHRKKLSRKIKHGMSWALPAALFGALVFGETIIEIVAVNRSNHLALSYWRILNPAFLGLDIPREGWLWLGSTLAFVLLILRRRSISRRFAAYRRAGNP